MKKRTLNRKTTHVSGDTELGRSWGYVRVTPQKSNENVPISNEVNLWTGKKPNRVIEVHSPSEFLLRNPITPVNRTPYVNERVIAVSSSKKKTNVEITSTIFTSRSGEFSKKRDTVSLELNEASTPSAKETDIPELILTPGISLPSDSTRISDFTLRLKKSLLNGRTGTEKSPLSKHTKVVESFTKQYSDECGPEHERRVKEIQSETSFSDMLPLPTGEKYSMINVILRKLQNQSVKSKVISKQGSATSIDTPSNFRHHPNKPNTIDSNMTFEEKLPDSTISHDISLEAVDGLVDLNSPLDDSDCGYAESMSPKEVLAQTVETQTDIDNRTHSPTDKDVQTSIVELQSQTTQTDTTIQNISPCSDTKNNSPTLTLSQIESPLSNEQEFSTTSSPTNEFNYTEEPHVSALFEDSETDTQHTIHPISTHEDLAIAIQHQLKSHVKETPFYEMLINDALPYAILNKNANQLSKSKKTFDEALNQFLDEHVTRASPVMSSSVSPVLLAPAPTFVKDNDSSCSYSYASYDGLDYSYVSKETIIDQLNQIKLNSEADDFKIRRKALEDLRALTIIVVGSEYEELLREELEFNQNEDVQHIIMEVFQLFQSCT